MSNVELLTDKHTGKFNGSANVDFESEAEAKLAFSSMMGIQVGQNVLYVKKCQPPTEDELAEELGDAAENEIFK